MSFFTLLILLALAFFRKKKNLIFLPVVIVAAAMIWSVVPQELKQRYESVQSLEKDESYQNRVLAWEAGWGMFKDSPLYGMGAGNYAVAAGEKYWPGKKRKIQLNAHSLYFQVMGELALMGIVAFTLFLVTLFKTNFALKKKLLDLPLSKMLCYFPTACNFALVVLLIAGYSSHTLYRTTWYILAAMTAALEGIVNRKLAEAPEAVAPAETFSAVTA
jgi:O-antigen ligase